MSRFGSDPLAFFESVYQGPAPWDIGGPQPAMVSLLDEIPPDGPVLDAGCGSGDLAIHVARLGVDVVGVDFVAEAIEQALAKRNTLPEVVAQRLDFRVGDALRPAGLGEQFGAVVDSGFYHLFDIDTCRRYADELARAIRPGGRLYLHAFAVEFPVPNVPRAVSDDELRAIFSAETGWRIRTLRPAEFLSRVAPVPAVVACIERIDR